MLSNHVHFTEEVLWRLASALPRSRPCLETRTETYGAEEERDDMDAVPRREQRVSCNRGNDERRDSPDDRGNLLSIHLLISQVKMACLANDSGHKLRA